MADQNTSMEKTEKATPKRRGEARDKGKVAKSMELNTAVMLAIAVLLILSFHDYIITGLRESFTVFLSYAGGPMDLERDVSALAVSGTVRFFGIVAPVLAGTAVAALLTNVMQVGLHASGEALRPNLERVNPLEGAKRILGKRALVELAKGIMKILVIGLVAWLTYRTRLDDLIRLAFVPVHVLVPQSVVLASAFLIRVVIALGVIAVLDFAYQRWDFEKSIMMTRQELKEELKESEGDPILKSRMKSQQQKLATQRMMEDVKRADVVVTNPTHFAVALSYEDKDNAPRVLGKGADAIAEKIKEVARENGIPVLEKPELARLLYAECEIGRLIPAVFFEAVAEVLAYVYALRNKVKR